MKDIITFDNVHLYHSKKTALAGIDLSIGHNEIFGIAGPSGCGKTSILKLISGLAKPTTGNIVVDGVNPASFNEHNRMVATVFQSRSLFPHMNVYKNIEFGLKVKGLPQKEIKERARYWINKLKLEGKEQRKPNQLSGGEYQRAAIARVMVTEPKILLLDEPFNGLDRSLKESFSIELIDLMQSCDQTFVIISHEIEDLFNMTDRVAIMSHGNVEAIETPHNLSHAPASGYVAKFVGWQNVLEGTIEKVNGANVAEINIGQQIVEIDVDHLQCEATIGAQVHVTFPKVWLPSENNITLEAAFLKNYSTSMGSYLHLTLADQQSLYAPSEVLPNGRDNSDRKGAKFPLQIPKSCIKVLNPI